MKKRRVLITLLVLVIVITALIISGNLVNSNVSSDPEEASLSTSQVSGEYSSFLSENEAYEDVNGSYIIEASEFDTSLDLVTSENKEGYNSKAVLWDDYSSISINVNVSEKGLYQIYFDYYSLTDSITDIELSVLINDELQYDEANQIVLSSLWSEESDTPTQDRYGNDVNILQEAYRTWQKAPLRDGSRLYFGGNLFLLEAGQNTITFEKLDGELMLGNIYVSPKSTYVSYSDYLALYTDNSVSTLDRYEAENMEYKNSTTISISSSRDLGVLPFSITKKKLNIIGDGSYSEAGDSVTWKVEVSGSGYYNLAFKVLQSNRYNSSYRTLYVNGEIPYEEAKHVIFSYNSKWQNSSIKSFSGEELKVYLEEGTNYITLEVDSSLFEPLSTCLTEITEEMNTLGLNIKKITGNNTDKGIDWDMLSYFPNLIDELNGWKAELYDMIEYIQSISGFTKTSYETRDMETVINYINKILSDVNELPRKLGLLSEGDSCAAQILAARIDSITEQPMEIDSFFIYTDDQEENLPEANANFFSKVWVSIERFFSSFFDPSLNDEGDEDELEIWVNRSRIYVDQLQELADASFTEETGIKVKISLMSDEGKLILANAADEQPDIALGVSAWIPNEFGMRGALYDLRNFSDLEDVVSVFNPEQLIPGIYDDALYSLPETENFYVLFYRKDILDFLGLSVPDTWDDVIDMLPTLERYGMSFYIPLSSSSSTKSFDSTSPFIYQFGGSLYADDGMSSGIDSENTIEAITFMTDLYKEYGLTYNVTSFFNEFRYGTIPIGIADFGTYLQLLNGAPELSGLWGISVVPGVERDGEVYRYMSGAQQSMMIFEKSDKKEEAWEFLKWWSSTETQVLYSNLLVNTYGEAYLWNTANLEAFSDSNWDSDDKEVILEQWEYLKEVPKIPGSYIIEREISNIWNAVVYDDDNIRSEISDSSIRINRELKRKLTQFGYYDSAGNKLRDTNIPSAQKISGWWGN
ncbi:MAG: extracellular solute-binding protein [Bacillales bacterium]|nr:extracellular solute-binding protein [Bacillales bacterium]